MTAHKAAVVDVLDWLADRGALRLSDGSADAWSADTERGDALYDIDHDICAALFRPARPVQHLTSAAGLLDATYVSAKRGAQREAAAQRAARALLEHPVVYYAQVEPEVAEALRQTGRAPRTWPASPASPSSAGPRASCWPTRAAASPTARSPAAAAPSTGRPACCWPRSPTSSRTPTRRRCCFRSRPSRPTSATCWKRSTPRSRWPGWSPSSPGPPRWTSRRRRRAAPATPPTRHRRDQSRADQPRPPPARAAGQPLVPFIADSGLRAMINDLYDELGPASFTVTWQHDPRGLLNAAVAFLADLRLLRRVDAGVLVLPAAARYRNIKAALPVRHAEGQLALDLFGGDSDMTSIGGDSDDD